MVIEVEVRSFVSDDEFIRLKSFFEKEAALLSDDDQETHYFDCDKDLRIQKAKDYSKVWLKNGKLHDEHREEIEIKVKKDDFSELQKLFSALGYPIKVKWLRKRLTYNWKGITVMLDDTKGYGKIIELERLGNESNKLEILNELKQKMNKLGIKLTPREEFDKKYDDYLRNWKERLKETFKK